MDVSEDSSGDFNTVTIDMLEQPLSIDPRLLSRSLNDIPSDNNAEYSSISSQREDSHANQHNSVYQDRHFDVQSVVPQHTNRNILPFQAICGESHVTVSHTSEIVSDSQQPSPMVCNSGIKTLCTRIVQCSDTEETITEFSSRKHFMIEDELYTGTAIKELFNNELLLNDGPNAGQDDQQQREFFKLVRILVQSVTDINKYQCACS